MADKKVFDTLRCSPVAFKSNVYNGEPVPNYVQSAEFQTSDFQTLLDLIDRSRSTESDLYRITNTGSLVRRTLLQSYDNFVCVSGDVNFSALIINPTTEKKELWQFKATFKSSTSKEHSFLTKLCLVKNLPKESTQKQRAPDSEYTASLTEVKIKLELPDDVIVNLSLEAIKKGVTLKEVIESCIEKGLFISMTCD
tara:strand:+ start:2680 stop:3267 length:588 start_codon:yes stop_codon:yes gene_type:complete